MNNPYECRYTFEEKHKPFTDLCNRLFSDNKLKVFRNNRESKSYWENHNVGESIPEPIPLDLPKERYQTFTTQTD